ncbi:MAG TPA: hypothetical protein VD713_05290, partial [Sphingomonadales bacterium]|nr:hypothetical protein [Sphingomonadales bacterium]
SEALEDLRRKVYENKLRETHEEIVPYALTFVPSDGGGPVTATLIDCDGRVALEYLLGNKSLEEEAPAGALAEAIQAAEALLLTVDAAAPPAQLEQDFVRFAEFLRFLEEHRGKRNEASGLPVYLVLSKCDLLAKADDSFSRWLERMEEGKRKIDERFREVMAGEEQAGAGLFGAIDLHLWATATRRPPLTDRPAKADEPFGVAELFRQVFESGWSFQSHCRQTSRRLAAAVAGVAVFVGLLLVSAAVFVLSRPSAEVTALESRLRRALPGATPADRLREPLEERLKQLGDIQADPVFAKLSPLAQEEVHQALAEIEAYQALNKLFKDQVQEPRFISRDEELVKNEEFLEAFALPAQY